MIRKIVFVLILIPLAIALIALTVANRQTVALNLDVFNPSNGALSFDAPFFVWLYAASAVGVIVGGIGSWLAQSKHRKKERAYKKEVQHLRYEMKEAGVGEKKTASSALALSNN
ncbi:LapA family protein [Ahrensia sp. 13_GOM-1096m]|jgi:hypothetical protein|uniref:LapA family protein n=1 Tax=Ahrensia sp. 13_GOM-1096m TaxID=1380380 RepID=UPI00047E66A6|nr:LapA family protein [Ahrensia sp. 13_GOM-1096m]